MTATIKSSLIINIVSGTGVTLDGPPVPAISADSIYNPQNPSQTLTEMLDLVAADAASAQEDAEKALANSVATPSLVTGSPPRPGEAPNLFGQTKTGSIDKTVLINPEWVATSTSGNVIRVHAPTGHAPQTIAPIAPVDLDSGQFYFVRWRVQRQTNPTNSNDTVACGIYWMDADKKGLDGGTTIVADIPLVVDDGVQEVSIVVGIDNPPNIVAPEGAAYFRPFIDLYGNTHVTDIIALETHDSVGMLSDASNAALPATMNNISAGRITMDEGLLMKMQIGPTASAGAATPEVPFTLVTSAPVQTDAQAMYVLHHNNGTPLFNPGAMYGGIVSAVQDVPCAVTDTGSARYVGLFGTGTARAIGGEGGVDTTLSVTATPGDTTITVVDATGFVAPFNLQLVTDRELVDTYNILEMVGNVITLNTPIIRMATAGNLVYRWRGSVKGLGAQTSTATDSIGMIMASAEFNWSAQSGSRPYIKSGLFLGANADDVVPAVGPYDSGIMMSRQTGSVGAKVGIGFSPISGTNLVNSSGTLVKTFLGGYTSGIDFSTSTFSGDAFASPGFRVTGNGTPFIENVSPQLRLIDTDLTPTTGGVWRMTVGDAGVLAFQANTSVDGDFATALTPITLTDTGDTLIGQSAVIPTTSTTQLLFIPTMTGPPTGVPAQATAGRTALVWNSGTKTLHVFDQASGSWFSI